MMFFGMLEFVLIALFATCAVLPLPIGVPPLPENPTLVRAAAQDSFMFVEWFGVADPDANSNNLTERMAAEPELRRSVLAIRSAIHEMAEHDFTVVFEAVELCLTRPGCLFVADITRGGRRPDPTLGIVVDVGESGAKIAAGLQALADLTGDSAHAPEQIDGAEFRILADEMLWAISDGYLVVARGTETAAATLQRIRTPNADGLGSNPRYRRAQSRVAVARPTFRSFVDLATLQTAFEPMFDSDFELASRVLGFDKIDAFASESGLESKGFVQRSLLSTTSVPPMFEILQNGELGPSDFTLVPEGAMFAGGVALSAPELMRSIFELIDSVEPGTSEQIRGSWFARASEFVGFDIESELFAHLGDHAILWSEPDQGGALAYGGLTLAIPLEDATKFRESLTRAMGALRRLNTPRGSRMPHRYSVTRFEQIDDHAHPIWFANPIGGDTITTPAWCATDSHLLVSVFPQNIVEVLERPSDGPSIARDPEFAARIASDGVLVGGYFDTKRVFDLLYPVLQVAAAAGLSQLQQEGFPLDMRTFPRRRTLEPYLRREFFRADVTREGLFAEKRGTLPAADPLFALTVPFVGMRFATVQAMQAVQAQERVAVARARVDPRVEAAKADVAAIATTVEIYMLKNGKAVPTFQQLLEPDEHGQPWIREHNGKDPWGNDYVIRGTGDWNFEVLSNGPDGKSGTDDDLKQTN